MTIRPATRADSADIDRIHRLAFGSEVEASLVRDILDDPTAGPVVSLIGVVEAEAVGHILFSAAHVVGAPHGVTAALLAPLAVLPGYQRQGIGGRLVDAGLQALRAGGVDLVFVLGDPGYYGRFGFEPALPHGLAPAQPIPEAYADAWMVQALSAGVIGRVAGQVTCCDALDRPEYWRE